MVRGRFGLKAWRRLYYIYHLYLGIDQGPRLQVQVIARSGVFSKGVNIVRVTNVPGTLSSSDPHRIPRITICIARLAAGATVNQSVSEVGANTALTRCRQRITGGLG